MIDAFAFGVAPVSFSHDCKPVGEQRVHGGWSRAALRRRRSGEAAGRPDGSAHKSRQARQEQHTPSRRHWHRRRDSVVIVDGPEGSSGSSSKAAPQDRLFDAQQHHGDAYVMMVAQRTKQQPAASSSPAVAITSPFAASEVQLARSLSRCCHTPRDKQQQARRLLAQARRCVAKSLISMWNGLAYAHVLSPVPGAGGMALRSHY